MVLYNVSPLKDQTSIADTAYQIAPKSRRISNAENSCIFEIKKYREYDNCVNNLDSKYNGKESPENTFQAS